jgi:tRNA G46 methylase TrmB
VTRAHHPIRRSAYADPFLAAGDFAFADEATFAHRGRWRTFFAARIGQTYAGRAIFEIGCNDGELLAAVAARHPEMAFVGIDWKFRALHTAAQRVTSAQLKNVALLHGRGQDIARIFGDGEVDEVWLLHPDPCDKPQELRNRILAEPFLLNVHRVLVADGSLILKTDHAGYYQWALELFGLPHPDGIARVRQKDLMSPPPLPKRSDAAIQRFSITGNSLDYWHDPAARANASDRIFDEAATPFESRFLRKRYPIYYLEMTKRRSAEPASGHSPCP